MTLVQQLKGTGHPLLLVDGGDCLFPAPKKKLPDPTEAKALLRKAETVLQAYNLLGYRAMGIGPADLGLGLDRLQELEKRAKFPFLCANLVDAESGENVFPRSVVIERGGVRFGLFSVLTNKINPTLWGRICPGKKVLDPIETGRQVVAELEQKADVIIALSQVDIPDSKKLLDVAPALDAVVDPHSKMGSKAIWVSANDYVTLHDGRPLLRIDGQGSRVGVVEMFFDGDERKISDYNAYDAPLEPHLMDHPAMLALELRLRRSSTIPDFAYNPDEVILSDTFLGQEGCGSCHEEQHAFWANTKHAHTFETLVAPGAEERTDCIGCHTLGYGVAFAAPKEAVEFREVQCENCHGLRPGHAESPKRFFFGTVKEGACWGCHNPKITQKKSFDYAGVLPQVSCPKMKR